jgi:hypothetical protein
MYTKLLVGHPVSRPWKYPFTPCGHGLVAFRPKDATIQVKDSFAAMLHDRQQHSESIYPFP